ncbi:MAG TPA: hypothetical protein VE870_02025, partial [Bacteroidales bacterium]|nr:hypothetical protein [Bacteroidales bacterium]
MKKAATFFSYVLHPLLMPTFGIIILLFSGQYVSFVPLKAREVLVILTAIGTFALPGITIPMFILRGSVSSLTLKERRERLFPL